MTSGTALKRALLSFGFLPAVAALALCGGAREGSGAVQLTVATVNNPDMTIMQRLSG